MAPTAAGSGTGGGVPAGPPGVPRDLALARVVARLLDDAIPIPGTGWRIGIDPLLGLVPGIGDAIGAVLAGWVVVIAARLGAPPVVLARMALHVGVDAVVGTIPLLGDAFDAGWKANVRNLRLLEDWLERPGSAREASRATVALLLAVAVAACAAIAFATWQLVLWAAQRVAA